MISPDTVPLVRGDNPEPEGGWPWYLTDYEIAYIRRFNVRPPRVGTWVSSPEAEHRLETEAEGIRQERSIALKSPWIRRRVSRSWPWIAVASVFVAGALALGAYGVIEYQQALSISQKTHAIKQEIASND